MAPDVAVMVDLDPGVQEKIVPQRAVRAFPSMAHPLNPSLRDLGFELPIQPLSDVDRPDTNMNHIVRENIRIVTGQQISRAQHMPPSPRVPACPEDYDARHAALSSRICITGSSLGMGRLIPSPMANSTSRIFATISPNSRGSRDAL